MSKNIRIRQPNGEKTPQTSLSEFIRKNELDPERNEDLEWYDPDKTFLSETIIIDGDECHIFTHSETGVCCAILHLDAGSQLLSEDELNELRN